MLYRGKGCASCNKTGYRGRLGIHELFLATDEMKRLIQTKARVAEMLERARAEGMTTLVQDGVLVQDQHVAALRPADRLIMVGPEAVAPLSLHHLDVRVGLAHRGRAAVGGGVVDHDRLQGRVARGILERGQAAQQQLPVVGVDQRDRDVGGAAHRVRPAAASRSAAASTESVARCVATHPSSSRMPSANSTRGA